MRRRVGLGRGWSHEILPESVVQRMFRVEMSWTGVDDQPGCAPRSRVSEQMSIETDIADQCIFNVLIATETTNDLLEEKYILYCCKLHCYYKISLYELSDSYI